MSAARRRWSPHRQRTRSRVLTEQPLPYWRLSGFYLFYFALLGASVPYWSLYLDWLSFDALEIGLLTGAVMAAKTFAPSLWGYVADRSGRRLSIIRWGAFLALVSFCGVFFQQGFYSMLLAVVGYSFFWNAVLAQYEVVTLAHLGARYNHYSRIRVWGSVGFILSSVGLGALFGVAPVGALPVVMTLLLAGIWACTLLITSAPAPAVAERGARLTDVLRRPTVAAFFCVCFLMQVGHGPYYTFFTLYLEDFGYGRASIGRLWALGVLAEIGVFMVMHRLLPRYGVRTLVLASLWLAVLRWGLIAVGAESLVVLLGAQLLHAATFGVFHAAGIELVRRCFPHGLAGQGQALYSGISFGAGGAVGAVLSGALWDVSAQATFWSAALVSLLALALSWAYLQGESIHE